MGGHVGKSVLRHAVNKKESGIAVLVLWEWSEEEGRKDEDVRADDHLSPNVHLRK